MSSGPGPRGGAPTERARNFTGTWRRLISELRPEMRRIALVVALTVIAVVLSVAAPKILARATNILFEGVMGSMLARAGVPEGTTGDRLARMLRAGGRDDYADMVSAYDVVAGRGLDGRALMVVLLQTLGVYLLSAVLLWIQGRVLAGVVQRTGRRLRAEVEAKLDRVPLSYIDRGSRGDMLSRVTNDVDNVAQTLQQTLSQALNSLMTVLGVFVMMLTISLQLSLISLVAIPVAAVGLLLKSFIEVTARSMWVIAGALIIWSAVMWFADEHSDGPVGATHASTGKGMSEVKVKDALIIGSFQALAPVLPGISRSGATISAGLFLRFDRVTATRLSFFMGIPALIAAGLLEAVTAAEDISSPQIGWTATIIATVVSGVVAYATIAWLLKFVSSNKFTDFLLYRVALGVIIIVLVATGTIAA